MNQPGPGFWPLALGATGLLLFAIAAGTLFFGKGSSEQRKLGCGFALLAALVWTLGLYQITDLFSAARLAGGLVLLLGVVDALKNKGSTSALRAGAFLLFGILLAGPVVYALVAGALPSEQNRRVGELDERVDEVRDRLEQIEGELLGLKSRRAQVRADLAGLGHASFDDLRADPRGVPMLQELARIDGSIRSLEKSAAELRAALPELEEQLARARDPSYGAAGAAGGSGALPAGVPAVQDPASTYEREAVRTIEELAAEEELRELFEREFPDSR